MVESEREGTDVLRVLVVDDSGTDRMLVSRELNASVGPTEIVEVSDQSVLDASLAGPAPDVVITDFMLGWTNGLNVLRAAREAWPDCPIVMFTGTGSEEVAVEALHAGLDDYVTKGHLMRLPGAIRGAIAHRRSIVDRRRAREELEQLAEDRRRLLEAVVTAQEDERGRIARELHDGLGQVLTSLALFATDLEREESSEDLRAKIAGFRERVRRAVGDMRRLVGSLRPVELDREGLVSALRRLAAEVGDHPGRKADLAEDIGELRFPAGTEITVYRVVQEAITNALGHGEAANISIVIGQRDERLIVVVEDDGVGFDPTARVEGYGILGMRERAGLAGGSVTIESSPGQGTTVRLEVPISP